MSKLINLSVIAAYLYILTVLNYYGYNSYFNIPYDYIGFSAQAPVVFFFDFSRLILEVAKNFTIFTWIMFVVIALVIIGIFFFNKLGRFIITLGLIGLIVYTFFGFYNLGTFLASSTTNFYTTASKCIPGATEDLYIAPTLFNGKVAFVPIDSITHKLKNGLLVRESSSLGCQLQREEIGKIVK